MFQLLVPHSVLVFAVVRDDFHHQDTSCPTCLSNCSLHGLDLVIVLLVDPSPRVTNKIDMSPYSIAVLIARTMRPLPLPRYGLYHSFFRFCLRLDRDGGAVLSSLSSLCIFLFVSDCAPGALSLPATAASAFLMPERPPNERIKHETKNPFVKSSPGEHRTTASVSGDN